MAKIAVALQEALAQRARDGGAGSMAARVLAAGTGWRVTDVLCTAGPQDRAYEEQHAHVSIAVVVAGSFQYRSGSSSELMTPGSMLLGNAGQAFECGHQHSTGDRCLSFVYHKEYFERVAFDAGNRGRQRFPVLRVPPLRDSSAMVARVCTGLSGQNELQWEELSAQLAARTVQLSCGLTADSNAMQPSTLARVTRVVRTIEQYPNLGLTLGSLAREAGLSSYHFLRVFEQVTGVTPHQYILRARLREAALRLAEEPAKILDIALDCGFGDVSNFNRAFRSEFGVSPKGFRCLNGESPLR